MTVLPNLPNRRSTRLREYDYSLGGAYFVTVCVHGRECLLGEIVDGSVQLSLYGEIVASVWLSLPNRYPHVELYDWVVMPNHFHGVLVFAEGESGKNGEGRHGLPEVIRGFKTWSSRRINGARGTPGFAVWQRSFHDHIIRSDGYLWRIQEYIANNPLQWEMDTLHPQNPSKW